jgi:hypothetical protein
MLDIWPPLPLVIYADETETSGVDNVVAALERSDRVREISVTISRSQSSEEVWKAMQEPLPELTFLALESNNEHGPASIIPDSFLGGSAPRLESLKLEYVPFPGLPKLLLSATNLAELSLSSIPPSGYISPEAMATGFSALTRLESLSLGFESSRRRPDRQSRRLPPPTRCVLPALTRFRFEGASKYLDDLVARVDVPRLNNFSIVFLDDLEPDTPHLVQFIRRAPYSKAFGKAHITFDFGGAVMVKFSSQTFDGGELNLALLGALTEWPIWYLTQLCTSSLPALPTLEDLHIHGGGVGLMRVDWQYCIENHQWLELLRPLIYVKNLYVSEEIVPSVVSALQELIGDRTTEVLPVLQNIFLEGLQPSGPVQEGIGQFVAARQLTRPITVSFRDSVPKQDSYSEFFTL